MNSSWSEFWNERTPRILLAPMEGVVDPLMRKTLTAIGGIDLCVAEFIRVTDRLNPKSVFHKIVPELQTNSQTESGISVLIQLLGGQPGPIAENAAYACELGASGIDLNFGCPAKTVNRHDGGATLLKIPSRVFDVTRAVRAAVPAHIPVSAKVRLGFSDKELHADIARAADTAGASWLTVHARTRDEGYRPPAHWEYIARMRELVSIPVIANGDIWTVEDYKRCLDVTGCTHVMLGRGLISNPYLALEIKSARQSNWPELAALLRDYADICIEERGEHFAVVRMKQWLKSVSRNSPPAVELFESIKRLDSISEILTELAMTTEPSRRTIGAEELTHVTS